MPSNTTLNTGSGGDVITTKERTHDGDATKQQGVFLSGVTGSEGSYTFTDVQAGGGTEAGALRVTIASDSTGVVSVDDNGSTLSIDDGGGTITVDGTVAATQSGTWNIGSITTLPTLANVTTLGTITNAVTVVGSAAEDAAASGNPVLIGGRYDSSPRTLETGDVGGIAVNASGQVLVEIAAGAGSGGTAAADGATFTRNTTSHTPIGAAVESSAPTLTNGDTAALSQDTSGNLRVRVAAGGIAGIVDDAAFTPGTSEVLPIGFQFDDSAPDSVNEGDIGCPRMSANRSLYVNIRDNAGNERGLNIDASGQLAVTLASAQTLATVTTVSTVTNITNQGHGADDAAFTPATTRVMVAGFFADETATDSVDEGDMGAARITLDRKLITTPYVHAAAGGQSSFKSLDLDESEEEVKGSAGKLFWIHCMNMSASVRYLKIYANTAAGTTVGTTTPIHTFPIPTLATTNGAGFNLNFGDTGISIATGICVAATTGLADNDTGAPGAGEVVFNCGFI